MNATRRMIYPKTWGYLVNGSWSGMLGDMVEGRAELAGNNPIKNSVIFVTLREDRHVQ